MITVFFGRWPWYFKFFLKTCSLNDDVSFKIISDNNISHLNYPSNVEFIHMTLEEVQLNATKKLGFEVSLVNPYKLCDFKPVYGFLFEDILTGFEFWGHCDIDLVYGQISNFIDRKVLAIYDIICVRHDYPSGFFTLYRNNDYINQIFKKSKDYEKVLSSSKHFCFDECNFQHTAIFNGVDIFNTQSEIESMMHVIKRAERNGEIKPYFDFCVFEGISGGIKWNNGILSYNNEYEILLYHFFSLKANAHFNFPKWKSVPNVFYIEKNGFFRKSKKNIVGLIERILVDLRFGFKKKGSHIFLEINKWIPQKTKIRNYDLGKYYRENKFINLFKENDKYYLDYGLHGSNKQLKPVFYKKNRFIEYHSKILFEFKKGKIMLRMPDGQEEVYVRRN